MKFPIISIVAIITLCMGNTPLTIAMLVTPPTDKPQLAAGEGQTDRIRKWLEADKTNVNKPDSPGGRTALYYAVSKENVPNRTEMVNLLLENGANPNIVFEKDGLTPFLAAAKTPNADIVQLLLLESPIHKANLATRDKEGRTILHIAVWRGPTGGNEIIERLQALSSSKKIDLASIINLRDTKGQTALHYAVKDGNTEALRELLLIANIDADAEDAQGRTPLMLAARAGKRGAIDALFEKTLAKGIDKKDHAGWTALHHAVQGLADYEQSLLSAKFTRQQIPEGVAPFVTTVETLLRKGATVAAKNSNGKTPEMLIPQGTYAQEAFKNAVAGK